MTFTLYLYLFSIIAVIAVVILSFSRISNDKDMKKNFKVGDRIMYRGYMYTITKIENNYYDVSAIPPYDEDGVVTCIGEAGSDGMCGAGAVAGAGCATGAPPRLPKVCPA